MGAMAIARMGFAYALLGTRGNIVIKVSCKYIYFQKRAKACGLKKNSNCVILDINECDVEPYPCKNNGTCIDGVASFRCECKVGYTGETCSSGDSHEL